MADIAAIRSGIADALSAIPDLQVSAYMLNQPTPPCAHVVPAVVNYDLSMRRGYDELGFTVQVFVPFVSDIAAQVLLDEYLDGSGARSVKAKVEADRTLGGACDNLHVTRCSGYQLFQQEGRGAALMAEWDIRVFAAG